MAERHILGPVVVKCLLAQGLPHCGSRRFGGERLYMEIFYTKNLAHAIAASYNWGATKAVGEEEEEEETEAAETEAAEDSLASKVATSL
jgi:hypothetical protein